MQSLKDLAEFFSLDQTYLNKDTTNRLALKLLQYAGKSAFKRLKSHKDLAQMASQLEGIRDRKMETQLHLFLSFLFPSDSNLATPVTVFLSLW